MSKIIERTVKVRLTDHLPSNNLLNPHQSGYCKHQSTETALLYIHDHIIIIIIIIERVWFTWQRLNSYKTTLQCHDESHSSSSSSYAQLELYHASGKLHETSSVLSSCLKAGKVVDEITSTCRAFQTRVAMTGKAWSPTVDSRDLETAKVSDVMYLTLCSSVDKYAIINAIGSQKLSCLCLLDLSAAFDTIDHDILLGLESMDPSYVGLNHIYRFIV